ncbi:hypothetical protein ACFRFH_12090 [Leifsonia sp. NPDC056824]
MRWWITTLGELAGIALITAGVWLIAPPAAFIVAGGALVGICVMQGQERR